MTDATTGGTDSAAAATKATATPAEVVNMSDGRKVEFAGKRKMLKESFFPENDMPHVRFDFRNGETRDFRIPEGLLNKFAAHGAEQKLGDETAGETDVDDMVLAVDELIERLNKNEWSVRREGGAMTGTSVLLKAMVEFSGKTPEQIKEFLKGKSQVEKMALRNSTQLKPIVDRLDAEKQKKAANIDTDALLAGLQAA